MFNDIGKKIKMVSMILCAIEVIAVICWGCSWMGYQRLSGVGVLLIFVGPVLAWLISLPLYGFGELIEQQEVNNAYVAQIARLLNRQVNPPKQGNSCGSTGSEVKSGYSLSQMAEQRQQSAMKGSDFWLCKSCKTKNDAFSLYCKNCGQFK